MMPKKYFPLLLGIFGAMIYVAYRNIAEIGLCPNVTQLNDGSLFCESTVGFGDYFWPLWHFSRALIIVGILVIIRPNLFRSIAIWTGVAAVAAFIGVASAPSIDSDLLLPIEKKGVGEVISVVYLLVSAVVFFWDIFRKRSAGK